MKKAEKGLFKVDYMEFDFPKNNKTKGFIVALNSSPKFNNPSETLKSLHATEAGLFNTYQSTDIKELKKFTELIKQRYGAVLTANTIACWSDIDKEGIHAVTRFICNKLSIVNIFNEEKIQKDIKALKTSNKQLNELYSNIANIKFNFSTLNKLPNYKVAPELYNDAIFIFKARQEAEKFIDVLVSLSIQLNIK